MYCDACFSNGNVIVKYMIDLCVLKSVEATQCVMKTAVLMYNYVDKFPLFIMSYINHFVIIISINLFQAYSIQPHFIIKKHTNAFTYTHTCMHCTLNSIKIIDEKIIRAAK